MCRMIAVVSKKDIDLEYFINKLQEQAENGKDAPHFHGYGMAYYTDKLNVEKEVRPINERTKKFDDIKTKAVIMHARKASAGNVVLDNVHPFIKNTDGKEFAFCHNGIIYDAENIKKDTSVNNKIDTEIYFEYLISNIIPDEELEMNIENSIKKIVLKCREITSLNSYFMPGDYIVISKYVLNDEDNYTLYKAVNEDMTIISTEKFDKFIWEDIKNFTVTTIK